MGADLEEASDWEFPEALRPNPEELGFDLDQALASVVALKALIPQDAFTASILGTERTGNGVVIRANGLVLTIGYLITEAEQVWLTAADGVATPAHVVAYDQGTGLGLVQALSRLNVPAIDIGSAASEAREGAEVIVAGHGGRRHAMCAQVIARQEFAGYWEYVIDDAIFTAPAHPDWGGTALIGTDGKLTGIGSLFLEQGGDEDNGVKANMVVPIDLLPPILDDLLRFGRVNRPPRPWLGMYTASHDEGLVVAGLAPGGPAEGCRHPSGRRGRRGGWRFGRRSSSDVPQGVGPRTRRDERARGHRARRHAPGLQHQVDRPQRPPEAAPAALSRAELGKPRVPPAGEPDVGGDRDAFAVAEERVDEVLHPRREQDEYAGRRIDAEAAAEAVGRLARGQG